MTVPLVRLDALGKTYPSRKGRGPVIALAPTDVSFAAGESVVVLGESGSGKSTLLSLVGLMETPTSGTLTFDGRVVTGVKERELARMRNEEFGFVSQEYQLLPAHSVRDNVSLPFWYASEVPQDAASRVEELLERFQIAGKADTSVEDLSGGQRQRVAVARALVTRPRVLLVDEPTSALDDDNAEAVVDALLAEAARGVLVLAVSHDARLSTRFGRVLRMKEGVLREDLGAPLES